MVKKQKLVNSKLVRSVFESFNLKRLAYVGYERVSCNLDRKGSIKRN